MAADRNKTSDTGAPNTAHPGRPKELATLMIVDHVKSECVSDYESWLTGIHTSGQT